MATKNGGNCIDREKAKYSEGHCLGATVSTKDLTFI